jgi:hypothetical protein
MQEVDTPADYRRTLAASTLIILSLEMLKLSKKIKFKEKLVGRKLEEYLRFFKFLTWNLAN